MENLLEFPKKRIISIVSGKGGVGKTTLAINLAISLSKFNFKTLLLDFNFTTPHISLKLHSKPIFSLNEFLEGKANLTEILNPSYNFFFISPSLNLQDLTNFSIENLEKLKYSLNNQYFDFVLIDSSPGFGKEALLSFSFADEILIVSNPTYLSLIDSIKCKQLAENLGKKVIGVILNRYSSQALREEDFERLLNLDVLGKVSESKFGKNIEVYGNQLYFVDKKFKEEIDRIAAKIAGIELKENLSSQFLNFFRNFWRR